MRGLSPTSGCSSDNALRTCTISLHLHLHHGVASWVVVVVVVVDDGGSVLFASHVPSQRHHGRSECKQTGHRFGDSQSQYALRHLLKNKH